MRLVIAYAACIFCLAFARPARAQLQGQIYASGFLAPVAFVQDPTDRTVQFVVQQGGRIRVVRNGTILPTDFLDLTGQIASAGERGSSGSRFRPTPRAAGSSSTSQTAAATRLSRDSAVRAIRWLPISLRDSI